MVKSLRRYKIQMKYQSFNNQINMIILFIAFFVITLSYVMTINSQNEFYQNAFLFIAPCTIEAMDYFFLKKTKSTFFKIFHCLLMFFTGFMLLFFCINVFFPNFIKIDIEIFYILIAIYPAKVFGNLIYVTYHVIVEKE